MRRVKWDWKWIIVGAIIAIIVFFIVVSISHAQPTSSTISPKAFGSKSWRENGLAPASLPLTNNLLWDVRLANDGVIYYWDGNSWESIVGSGSGGGTISIEVGTTTTGSPGTQASVVNSGTETDLILDFTIPRGDVGATGATGANGTDGIDGTDGADGSAATITVGNTTTGVAGSSASVTNVGTSNAAILDFVIPRGDTGLTGATGAQGAQGPQGAIGPAGPIAGLDTQVIYNKLGAASGDAGLTYNDVTDILTVVGIQASNIRTTINTISSTNTNGNINILPNGTGQIVLNGPSGLRYYSGDGLTITNGGSGLEFVSAQGLGALNVAGGAFDVKIFSDAGLGRIILDNEGQIKFSQTGDTNGTANTMIERQADGVFKFSDALRLNPRTSPPVTCGSAGSESLMYYDNSHALCVCGTSTWHNLTPSDGGSCS